MGFLVAALSLGFVFSHAAGNLLRCIGGCPDAQAIFDQIARSGASNATDSNTAATNATEAPQNMTEEQIDQLKKMVLRIICPTMKKHPDSCILSQADCAELIKGYTRMEVENIKKECAKTPSVTVKFTIMNLDYDKVKNISEVENGIVKNITNLVVEAMEGKITESDVGVTLKSGSVQATVVIVSEKQKEISKMVTNKKTSLENNILAEIKKIVEKFPQTLEDQNKELTIITEVDQDTSKAGKAMVSFMIVLLAQLLM